MLAGWQHRLAALDASANVLALEAQFAAARSECTLKAAESSAGRRKTADEMSQSVSEVMHLQALSSSSFEVALCPMQDGAGNG